ncbi:MAG: ATP-binding cassette domain-containing protein [Pirellulaceae bacterium]|nr:ATP-binding cassette domain-containing protein [Planctomycetales bacterium]
MTVNMLEVRNVSHWFGTHKVLNNVNITMPAGQIAALVGPSGCGKSTLLRAILGTHPPRKGEILANGRPILRPSRDIGIVYQHYSLYDFLTARQNVAFGLMLDQTNLPQRFIAPWTWWPLRRKHLKQADELLEKVGLAAAAKRYPSEMSGGMRQRVAIAQALIMKPRVLLLDEPFGALDEATREELQLMLLQLYEENTQAMARNEVPRYTILIVTHELNEAIYVSDRVLGLSQYHTDGVNGATILYDEKAPVFRPGDPRDFAQFEQQKDDIRCRVFDPDTNKQHQELVKVADHIAPK